MRKDLYKRRQCVVSSIGNTALTLAGVVAICLVLATSFHLDSPTDHSAEWEQADYLLELQNAATAQHRLELAAQSACEDLRGYNTTARFDADGTLFCAGGQTLVKLAL